MLENTSQIEKLNVDQFNNNNNKKNKTVINLELRLKNSFQEIFYRVNSWINEGSGLIIELTESQYINVSTYRPLSGILT